ncbi:MAG: hypothetical protein L6Q98_03660 [Anaerolineae bacterium]|nr:hypothetical protein [Anaerolineae bacterium]NUQ02308.1 hypothetical protein [Anaerolineae bacterium]
MSNTSIQPTSQAAGDSRSQTYLLGAAAGLLFGLLSAYLYNRAAGESQVPPGTQRVKSGELIALGLTVLGLVRQVSEMGRPDLKHNKRR